LKDIDEDENISNLKIKSDNGLLTENSNNFITES
jgi:hypothetical protein